MIIHPVEAYSKLEGQAKRFDDVAVRYAGSSLPPERPMQIRLDTRSPYYHNLALLKPAASVRAAIQQVPSQI